MNTYGLFLPRLADDFTDLVGIRTLTRHKTWQASRGDLTQEELDAEEPLPPDMPPGMLLVGSQTRPNGGGLRTSWTWRGVRGDGKSVTFKDRAHSFDTRFDPGLENIPIQHHPDFIYLRDNYGGFVDGNEIIWSPTLKGNTSTRGLGGAAASGTETLNPMFGRQDYFSANGTYSHRYVSFTLTEAMSKAGRIHQTGELPGSIAKKLRFDAKRDWYKAPSPFVDLGFAFEVMEIYWLSAEGGWPAVMYGGKTPL